MRQPFLIALLAIATIIHFETSQSPSSKPTTAAANPTARAASSNPVPAAPVIQIVSAPARSSYAERWKTGPNAQTDFEPFQPSEQEHWNDSPGYTVVSGRLPRK